MTAPTPGGLKLFSGPDAPKEEDLYKCVHCGFCLQACPTYVETGLETESPRGRIALMKAVNEGRIGITPTVFRHWDLCIQCRACEVACPSGVPYGRLIEATKAEVERHREPRVLPRLAAAVLLKRVLPSQRRLSALVAGLRLYQRSGLRWLVRWIADTAPGLRSAGVPGGVGAGGTWAEIQGGRAGRARGRRASGQGRAAVRLRHAAHPRP